MSKLILLATLILSANAHSFETCTPQNDYLENGLPAYHARTATANLPMACVESAQLTLAQTGYYGYCATDAGQPTRSEARPCISEAYVGAVYNQLADATECFGYDTRWAFAVFNLESALHLNAVGAATDIGIGQLTTSAINEVNLNALPAALRQARKSKLPACAHTVKYLYAGDTSLDHRCSFITVPSNPGHDLSFGVLLLKRNHLIIENFITRLGITFPHGVNGARVKTLLSFLAYNSGAAGIASNLKGYIDHATMPLTDDDFDFENHDPGSFMTYVYNNFPSQDEPTRKRVSKYVGYIIKAARHVESTLQQGECSDQSLFSTAPHNIYEGFGDPVEPSRAEQAVVENHMVTLAHSFQNLKVSSDQDCSRVQAEFRYAFAPHDEDWNHVPVGVAQAYAHLCAK